MTTAKQDLQKIEKAVVKLQNKLKRADINYTVQVSIASVDPTKVTYAAQLTPPADSLAPITFIDHESADSLVAQIKASTKHIDLEKVEVAYHKAQIEACERTKLAHEERIKAIENPEPEEPAEAEEETNTDETNEEETNK